ncbi:hypothetical protein KIW84_041446 [Lathyrus oleraceus]|uniref:Retrovirus-related Pol polyprotein from transposon TNT 1-94-like beta-barrel domain-containing protein n=1 Tax=Pisum sativum TaxID=3888 RepID=A0A9D5ARK2_PEA|nr:hypothetical protein KIW84_041446 [Pisum sativum]
MASTSNTSIVYSNFKVPLFEGENYDFWAVKMETLFTYLDVLEFVQNGYAEPAPTEAEESSQRLEELKKKKKITDAGVLRMIQRALRVSFNLNSTFSPIMLKINPQYKIEVSLLEVEDLEEAWVEEETHEEEEETRMAEDGMKEHQINGAKSVRVTLTTRMIAGTRVNHNVTIVRDSGIFKRIFRFVNQQHASFAEGENDEGNLFFACQKAFQEDKNVWYLDSGCSNHMTGKKEAFINIDSSFGSKVKLVNGEHVEVKGKGSIGVTTKQGSKVIHDTLYVTELDENLLSIGQLLEHGYSLNFENP